MSNFLLAMLVFRPQNPAFFDPALHNYGDRNFVFVSNFLTNKSTNFKSMA